MENKDNSTNFWISYADLMAGLLFVFILLIGAIIVKYSLLQSESKLLEKTLKDEKSALEQNKKKLKIKEEKIKNALSELKQTKSELQIVNIQIKEVEENLKSSILENEKTKLLLEQNNEKLLQRDDKLNTLVLLEKELKEKLSKLSLEKENLEENSKTKDEKINKLLEDVLLKELLAKQMEEKSLSLDTQIKILSQRLNSNEEKHKVLIKDLEATKEKIKNFTGIKVKVISLLKSKLGKNIQIDPNNGSIRLSSNILFDEGKDKLKEASKKALKNAVYDYFYTILENEEINKHIDKVIIEGHTNSKGNFLYNLELSQKRAYSVMDFLLSLDFKKKENLRGLIVASGRSFLDPIYDKNGLEDKNASRRIEIKFSLKNEQAIKEIANILK